MGKGQALDPGKAAPSSPPSASCSGVDAPFAFKIHKDRSFVWKAVKGRGLDEVIILHFFYMLSAIS